MVRQWRFFVLALALANEFAPTSCFYSNPVWIRAAHHQ
jgi:hypothetical protein